MYFVATKDEEENSFIEFFKFLVFFPKFLTTMLGLTTYNVIAVLEGYLGKKSPFVRTPKYNVNTKTDKWSMKNYAKVVTSPLLLIDLFIIAYAVYGISIALEIKNYSMLVFLLMVIAGFSYTLFLSLFDKK